MSESEQRGDEAEAGGSTAEPQSGDKWYAPEESGDASDAREDPEKARRHAAPESGKRWPSPEAQADSVLGHGGPDDPEWGRRPPAPEAGSKRPAPEAEGETSDPESGGKWI